MQKYSLVLRYALFAALSTGVNLFTQWITSQILPGTTGVYAGMLLGTGTGLLVKYILDKKFIFYYQVYSLKKDIQKFLVYTLMGVFTTAVFWGSEFAFYKLFENENLRYIGAAIGLTLGYILKYLLDRRFVFRD